MIIASEESNELSIIPILILSLMTALIAVGALFASQTTGTPAAVGVGVVVFLSAFSAGALLGFLFGIPRVLARERPVLPATGTDGASEQKEQVLQSNTNLERISDWLATLLVGVGLSQLHNINTGLIAFRDYIAATATVFVRPDGTYHAGVLPAVAPPFLVAGASVGFLLMYLYTRTSLVRVLDAVERDLLTGAAGKRLKKAAGQIADETGSFVAAAVSKSTAISIDDALSLMYNTLYKRGEHGRVIRLAKDLFHTSATERPEFWFYLAAAFGQQLQRREKTDEEGRREDRINALDAARRAVQLDPSFKGRLDYIADPKGPEKDLAPLSNDPEFKRIIT